MARIKRLGARLKYDTIVNVAERKRAADEVLKLVQEQAFPEELNVFQRNLQDAGLPRSSPLFKLNPCLEGGLLRVGGRLRGSTLSVEQRHPVILPKDGHVTKLILSHFHSHVCHQGRNQTLMELRAHGFWIIGGSKTVGKLVHKCVQCRR